MKKLIISLILILIISGCASRDIRNISGSHGVRLDPKQSVYVSIPGEPSSDYQSAGQYVGTTIAGAFSKRGIRVSIASAPATFDANLATARSRNDGYLISSVITNWEHNATQWSFNPSTMGVRLTIIDVATGKQIRVDDIESQSSHLSFFGTDPKELLKDSLEDYVDDIYGDA